MGDSPLSAHARQEPLAAIPAPLWGSVLVHRTWRRSLGELDAVLAGSGTGTRAALLRWFARWFAPATTLHTGIEDRIVWPALRDRRPGAVASTDVMFRQRDLLAAAVHQLHERLGAGDVGTVRRLAAGLAAVIDRHAAFVEEVGLPLLEVEFAHEELTDLMRQGVGLLSLDELAVVVPFALAYTSDGERERVLSVMSPALATEYEWTWRARYERDAAVLRGIDPAAQSSVPARPRFQ